MDTPPLILLSYLGGVIYMVGWQPYDVGKVKKNECGFRRGSRYLYPTASDFSRLHFI